MQGRRHRVDHLLGRDAPFDQREGPFRGDRDDLALLVALRHGGEPLPHGDLGVLAHVAEQVLADSLLCNLAVMQGFSRAPQHLDGRFGERHVEPLQLPAGLREASLGPVEKGAEW